MKRIIAVITVMFLFVPILSYAGDKEGWYFHDDSIYIETDEAWNVKESTTVEYVSEEYICARAFTGFKDSERIDMFFVTSEDIPDTGDGLEEEYSSCGEPAVRAVADYYFMDYDTYDISIEGSVESQDNEYLKLKPHGEYLDYDYFIYFARTDNAYAVFTLRDHELSEQQVREAEEILAAMEDYGCADFMFDSYDLMGSPGIDGFDMIWNGPDSPFGPRGNGDFGDYIVGIIGIVIGLIVLAIFIAARKMGRKKETVIYMDGESLEYSAGTASSDSYEKSIRTMLDSGVITKKEYRELLKKHRR